MRRGGAYHQPNTPFTFSIPREHALWQYSIVSIYSYLQQFVAHVEVHFFSVPYNALSVLNDFLLRGVYSS